MTTPALPPLALLIDGENVSHQFAPELLREAMTLGDPILRYVYGRSSAPATVAWQRRADDHGLHMHAPPRAVTGKNASDMSMVICAMHVFYTTSIRHFCLVSSDSDFTELALNLREAGCTVWVVGNGNAHAALRSACARFIPIESLHEAAKPVAALEQRAHREVIPLINAELARKPEGRISLADLRSRLPKRKPGFNVKSYGQKTLTDLVRHLSVYSMIVANGKTWVSPLVAAGGKHP
jgi:uncharacterized LabA/DUF88 family protein